MFSKSNQPTDEQQDHDIQQLRRQARTRLIGALILILILVTVFSILLQKSPQAPVSDIPFVATTAQPRVAVPESLPPEPTFVPQTTDATEAFSIDVPTVGSSSKASKTTNTGTGKTKASSNAASQWVVQLGAFRNPKSVIAALKKAKKTGVNAFTRSVDTPTGKLTRVQVGPFASEVDAEKAVLRLKKMGFKAPSVKKSQ